MARLKPDGLAELRSWTRGNIMEAYERPQGIKASNTDPSKPLEGEGIGMGSKGINVNVIELKKEYIEQYGHLSTEEAKLIIKEIFPENLSKRMLEIQEYTQGQLEFALDVGANALVLDYDSFAAQFNRLKPWGMVKAALDLWDVPDADDLRDELDDGFDDLSSVAKAVVKRYNHVAMGSGGVFPFFESLK